MFTARTKIDHGSLSVAMGGRVLHRAPSDRGQLFDISAALLRQDFRSMDPISVVIILTKKPLSP
jgi:hypothetical protein